jgi:hypothetical protein
MHQSLIFTAQLPRNFPIIVLYAFLVSYILVTFLVHHNLLDFSTCSKLAYEGDCSQMWRITVKKAVVDSQQGVMF